MNTLVVGYGSIGSRHAEVLTSLGHRVCVVSARETAGFTRYPSVAEAVLEERPDYVVVANRTSWHYQSLQELHENGYDNKVLVEKPLFHHALELPGPDLSKIFVAYNLRFHPAIARLRQMLAGERVLSAHLHVGQYLPQWRSNADYRNCYSARRQEGGGVLRDLSHELDYLTWMLGGWQRVVALGGHFSSLEIDSDDIVSATLVLEKCLVATVQLNYLERPARRSILINTERCSIEADLIQSTLRVDDSVEHFPVTRNLTYELQHQALLADDLRLACGFEQGMQVNRLIDAIERSISEKGWVANE